MQELFSCPESNGAQRANEQTDEATPWRRASPEHAKQEGRQQWGIDHGEQDLDIVHNTVDTFLLHYSAALLDSQIGKTTEQGLALLASGNTL